MLSFSMPNIAGAENNGQALPVANDVPRQVYWGDTHLHTRLCTDAFSFGNPTLGPEDALPTMPHSSARHYHRVTCQEPHRTGPTRRPYGIRLDIMLVSQKLIFAGAPKPVMAIVLAMS
jgi:Protein of unknown function (DUF3604)